MNDDGFLYTTGDAADLVEASASASALQGSPAAAGAALMAKAKESGVVPWGDV